MSPDSTREPSSTSPWWPHLPFAPVLALLLGGLLIAGACGDSPSGPDEPAPDEGSVEIRASVQSPTVSTLVVEVTGPGIPDPQVFNLELVGTDTDGDGEEDEFTASGTLVVPAGDNRLFEVRAFDDAGIRTHEGSSTMHVTPGPNASAVVVTLNPLTGDQPIDIVLGSFDVAVTPEAAEIDVGVSQEFTAVVTDQDGTIEDAEVRWASSNPDVAAVNATGNATGKTDGTARIAATWMGVDGVGELTVGSESEGDATRSRIAFSSSRSDATGTTDSEIWVVEMDAAGAPVGSPVQATTDDAHEFEPAWSPDGSRIAFRSFRSDAPGTGNDIWVVEVDAAGAPVGSPIQVTTDLADDGEPAWSPDGSRIAFLSFRSDGAGGEIWVVEVDAAGAPVGSAIQVTTSDVSDRNPVWSPDGSRIAFESRRSDASGTNDAEIWVMEVDAAGAPVGSAIQVTTNDVSDRHPAWSPDGSRIAFESRRSDASGTNDAEIWVVEVDAVGAPVGSATQVTTDDTHDVEPAWSPDGSRIAFKGFRSDATGTIDAEIWAVEVDATGAPVGSPVQVTTDGASDGQPVWADF